MSPRKREKTPPPPEEGLYPFVADSDDDDPFGPEHPFVQGLRDLLDEWDGACCLFSLTVAESKRLIAKGIAGDPRVCEAMEDGFVAVCKGTTNAYVLEELLGKDVEKGKYVLGRTVPQGSREAEKAFAGSIPEVIFKDGKPLKNVSLAEALQQMGPGDVVLKGANALDYERNLAGVLIGHPAGGTMGTILGHVYGKGLHLIIPVGLEKQISGRLLQAAVETGPLSLPPDSGPRLWPVHGSVFTEIEALEVLADVQAVQVAAGGVCGAEGAVWLLASGPEENIALVEELVEDLRGEPSFWEAVMGK